MAWTSAPSLADLQTRMQAAILAGDRQALVPLVRAGAHAGQETLISVYTSAYVLRLIGILKADLPLTAAYLGDDPFARAARSYIAAHPSPHRSARWVGDRFAAHLAKEAEFAAHPQCSELASLEWALGCAFDAPDAPTISLADLASIPPEAWSELSFPPHPSAALFTETWNAFEIWSALKDEATPPRPHRHAEPITYVIWRRDGTPTIRGLSAEEAMLWREAERGAPFGRLCEFATHFDDPNTAAHRVATYVQVWLAGGALSGVMLPRAG
ncbi:MAG: hypothetical protein B7Y80_03455 [Hyphomicrobium sp. 32-62-53]|nr:MAG: hypothetical protein B7Z29_06815 [Hyphomicrobium sp. 12-62-95]OYY00981.1 MAG: hypothetical protein B7Y80_03455 [Hyphomicrobium sp. 32-62-53]